MEFLKLYDEENRDILFIMSWLNKNSIFDKSIGSFEDIDLFTFLENINSFDYQKDILYDDIYYILEYTQDSIFHLINNINKEIKREHNIIPISQAKEFDKKTILWLSRQDGRTIKEKLKNNKIKAVQRYKNVDTYENRIFKIFLKKLVLIEEKREQIQSNEYLIGKIRQWLRSDDAKSINEYGNIVYNNILLHHPHYSKIFKSYKWLNRLDEKVEKYKNLYPKQIIDILVFSCLSKLQFKTKKLVLPDTLNIDYNQFEIDFNEKCLPENIGLFQNVTNLKVKTIEEVNFNNIATLEKNIIDNQLNIELNQERTFIIGDNDQVDKIFIDFFRLFPIASIDKKIINFPITLKQIVKDKLVNANNTKIIDLNNEIYTLPEILKTYNINMLRHFLKDLDKYFKDKQFNYIIPDYVNIFEFSQVKKTVNSYFRNNRSVPKSILAGLKYLFEGNCNEEDTLIYIQKDHSNTIFATPLLIRYDESLKLITNGLYIEKHPTKKLMESTDILDALGRIFSREDSKNLLNKFLKNGIKRIKKENIVFQNSDSIISLEKIEIPHARLDESSLNKIKKSYTSSKLFKKDMIFVDDDNIDNLNNFEKLLQYEKDEFTLWREHLPKLSMQIVKNGYYDEFVLVNDESEVINGKIEISNHFVIPANTNQLSFPLVFDEESINFEAYITSNDLPLTYDLICELQLTYNYENETPYELIFISLDNSIKPLKVSWREIQYKECSDLPIPKYPPKKKWENFLKDPKRDGNGYSNLLEWIEERLDLLQINKVPQFIIDRDVNQAMACVKSKEIGYFEWGAYDKNKNYYCRVNVDGNSIFCPSKNFVENINPSSLSEGDEVFLNISEGKQGKIGKDIRFSTLDIDIIKNEIIIKLQNELKEKSIYDRTENIVKAISSIKYPLLTVWNEHSLTESSAPDNFREKVYIYIEQSLKLLSNKDVSVKLKHELLFFLSSLHQDMPKEISNTLLKFSSNLDINQKYFLNIALSLGSCKLQWQKDILNNILDYLKNHSLSDIIINILAIASWRSEDFILILLKYDKNKIIDTLFVSMEYSFSILKNKKNNRAAQGNIIKQLELLLALVRLRKDTSDILCPQNSLTKKYIQIIDEISKFYVEKEINIRTRLKIELVKQEDFQNIPDLLYALRIYLTGDTNSANSIKIIGISDD